MNGDATGHMTRLYYDTDIFTVVLMLYLTTAEIK